MFWYIHFTHKINCFANFEFWLYSLFNNFELHKYVWIIFFHKFTYNFEYFDNGFVLILSNFYSIVLKLFIASKYFFRLNFENLPIFCNFKFSFKFVISMAIIVICHTFIVSYDIYQLKRMFDMFWDKFVCKYIIFCVKFCHKYNICICF